MAKSKSILISGNPFVQIRDTKEGDKYTMRLVYNLGDIYEMDAKKTGALIIAAAKLGCIAGGLSAEEAEGK